MLRWALIFLVFALVAGLFGFTGITGESMYIARVLLGVNRGGEHGGRA